MENQLIELKNQNMLLQKNLTNKEIKLKNLKD